MHTKVVDVVRLVDANKAKAAFLAPLVVAVGAAAGSWLVTGNFDATVIRTAAEGAVLAATGGVAAYLKGAGKAVVKLPVPKKAPAK